MLTIVEDTTEGVHDTLIAACDKERYVELGGEEGHRHCAGNLIEGLGVLGTFYVFFGVLLLHFHFCYFADLEREETFYLLTRSELG